MKDNPKKVCSKCGNVVDSFIGFEVLVLDPCENCLEKSRAEGYLEGFEEGKEEGKFEAIEGKLS